MSAFTAFQYISCCYLSGEGTPGEKGDDGFNTSHVVIYPVQEEQPAEQVTFQYISCCYLSELIDAETWMDGKFQYISCCYLSRSLCLWSLIIARFNTSHVVIYQKAGFDDLLKVDRFQYISCCYLSTVVGWNLKPDIRFNTSHVVIYLYLPTRDSFWLSSFQYISCCYLSRNNQTESNVKSVSIHLMLLFIGKSVANGLNFTQFQYISFCYLS